MTDWRPSATLAVSRARAGMLDAAREFFRSRGVLEVTTPALSAYTVSDPRIASVVATAGGRRRYLQTSPEYHMKRLLAAGYPDIFQIAAVFRDEESGRRHLPEFTLAEWYRTDYSLQAMIDETATFVRTLLGGERHAPVSCLTYADAFRAAAGLDPLSASVAELAAAADADRALRATIGDDRDAWLDLLMATRVAPTFVAGELTAVYHYPASQAALARLCPDDPAVADRFEIFVGALEIANGFVELGDPREQLARFEIDNARRSADGLPPVAIDAALIGALEAGLPSCAGVAVGLDRLLMIDQGLDDIRQTVCFGDGATYED